MILCWAALSGTACRRSTLPVALTDHEFWSLIEAVSEPAGTFSLSENLVSNEPHVAENIRWMSPRGGVYIGVGPEQNFSYIARLRPAMAFIIDIRRENLNLHLFYKALFELSSDRADFVSRLFSRPVRLICSRPRASRTSSHGITAWLARPNSTQNATLVRERLQNAGLPLSQIDLDWIDHAPRSTLTGRRSSSGVRATWRVQPSYRQLMTAKDVGEAAALATEEGFNVVRAAFEKQDRPRGRRFWRTERHTTGRQLRPGA